MLNPSTSVLFDESQFEKLPDLKKPLFIFDWLLHLERRLPHEAKKDIQEFQEDLVQQLLSQLTSSSSPPTHRLIGRCLAKLFIVGDTLLLYTAVNTCNGMLRSRDDGAASTTTRLAALACLRTIYKSMGRLIGRSFEDSVSLMVRLIKQSESQVRCETMLTLCSLLEAIGPAASVCNKEIYKAAKSCMVDRVLSVRAAACKCLYELTSHYVPLYTNDLESMVSLCFRCMDGSNHTVRMEAARLVGRILTKSQQHQVPLTSSLSSPASVTQASGVTSSSRSKTVTLNDALAALAPGFLRGPGGFLKGSTATDMLKGTNSVNREVRIGVTYAYIEFVSMLGPQWFESNLNTIISHCVHLLVNPRAIPTQAEAIFARHCVGYILTSLFHRLLSEPAVLMAARELATILRQHLNSTQGAECLEESGVELDTVDSTADSSKKVAESANLEPEDANCVVPSDSPKTIDADPNVLTRRGFGRGSTRTQRQRQQQHVIVCILDQLTEVIRQLDSICAPLLDQPVGIIDLLCTALVHPVASVRLAAAKCLRQLVVALPHQRASMMDRCISSLRHAQRYQGDSFLGYGGAIAAILAGATVDVLGMPSGLANQVFCLAEELLREANQNSRLTLPRTQTGWILLASYLSLGSDLVRPRLPQLLLFWRNAFPRSVHELEAEKQRGDAFTWQIVLEARAGALCSIQAFLEYCAPLLHAEDVINRLLAPIECALNMLSHLLDLVRLYGNHLKAITTMIRHRLYRILLLLPHTAFTSSYSTLLRELVAEFTLTDSAANTTTSLLRSLCRSDDNLSLSFWTQDTDQKALEDQVQPNTSVAPGALEHDPAYLFLRDGLTGILINAPCPSYGPGFDQDLDLPPHVSPPTSFHDSASWLSTPSLQPTGLINFSTWSTSGDSIVHSSSNIQQTAELPPPVSVAVIDSAVELFGRIYPCVPVRHRVQMMEHFSECIRLAKSARQEAIQINVFAALLSALRRLAETKVAFGEASELRDSFTNLIMTALSSPCVPLRCAAGECMGRLAQLIAEPSFLSELAQNLFERLRSIRNPISRAGHCLAIGCLHRYVGGLASGQHVNTSVGILLAVAQDSSVPEVQVWALYALALIADSGGPLFREFVNPSLDLVLQLLLRSPTITNDIQRGLGRLLSTLITTLGPELHGTGPSITLARRSSLICCLIMQHSNDPALQAEAVLCMQRLHMFAAQHVEMPLIAHDLQAYLSSPHLLLRRAAASYFRQLSQKGWEDLLTPVSPNKRKLHDAIPDKQCKTPQERSVPLELQLFRQLDVETDVQIRRDIEETILSLLQMSAHSRLNLWLTTLKDVLQATTVDEYTLNPSQRQSNRSDPTSVHNGSTEERSSGVDSYAISNSLHEPSNEEVLGDGDAGISESLGGDGRTELHVSVITTKSRWSTRVFAVGCLRILIAVCFRMFQMAMSITKQPSASSHSTLTNDTKAVLTDSNAIAHFDLALARRLRISRDQDLRTTDSLVLHLSDLIRIAFISATYDSNLLRISGLKLMQDVIRRFARVADPDCAGHFILEQYQAQVSAALRPAFLSHPAALSPVVSRINTAKSSNNGCTLELNPLRTSVACLVCSTWIASGVVWDTENVRRVHELLRRAFDDLQLNEVEFSASMPRRRHSQNSKSNQLYCTDAMTMEKLAVLRAWADVYTSAVYFGRLGKLSPHTNPDTDADDIEQSVENPSDQHSNGESDESDRDIPITSPYESHDDDTSLAGRTHLLLSQLVQPLLPMLSKAWIAILQDYALLNLPDELSAERPATGGTFYGCDANIVRVRTYYMQHWPTVLLAASMWIQNELCGHKVKLNDGSSDAHDLTHCFNLILGICVHTLCDTGAKQSIGLINTCLEALLCLLRRSACRTALMCQYPKPQIELLHVLYRLILTVDYAETHLLCLSIVKRVLQGAEERLVKQREIWLSENSSACESRLLLNSDGTSKAALTSMTSSTSQTTSLVDAQMYELSEGGCLSTVPQQSEKSQHSVLHGLQPEHSIVFAALEVVVCVFARYRPQLLTELHMAEPTAARNPSLPEARCASDADAASVLAGALRCLIPLPDLCAPHILLTGLRLSNICVTNGGNEVNLERSDDLLIVLLDSLVRTCQIVLIQPQDPISSSLHEEMLSLQFRDEAFEDSTERQHRTPSYALYLCDIEAHTDVTSTADSTQHSVSTARRRKLFQQKRQLHVDRMVSWTWQQSQLAKVAVCLAVRLATHHYPVLATTQSPVHSVSSCPTSNGTVGDAATPDSSSAHYYTLNYNSMNEACSDEIRQGCRSQPTDQDIRLSSAASQWYDLVSGCLLELLHHQPVHAEMSSPSCCCLRSLLLVSRIAAECPVTVFNSKALRNQLVLQLRHAWEVAGLPTPSTVGTTHQASCVGGNSVPLASSTRFKRALTGLVERRVCLSAIELLVNHREPLVSTFFARTITPQIFRWIYDLSTQDTSSDPPVSHNLVVSKNALVDCFHSAVDILEVLVNLSDTSNRQGLLVILIPLLCGLLSPSPPTKVLLSRWSLLSSTTVDSAELRCGLHINALQRLVSIAPRYPTDFRSVFSALGDHKSRLQLAIKASTTLQDGNLSYPVNSSDTTDPSVTRPVIKLKTNFGSFLQDTT